MSPRKPTIDDLDDVDDEDGVLEEEAQQDTDLSLDMRRAEEVGLGGSPETAREEEGLLPDDAAETFDDEDDDQEER
jgi:hypothetical protein